MGRIRTLPPERPAPDRTAGRGLATSTPDQESGAPFARAPWRRCPDAPVGMRADKWRYCIHQAGLIGQSGQFAL